MRRIVLDTSVVVAGLRTRLEAGNAVLQLVAEGRLIALATLPLYLEYEDVLKRPEHRLAQECPLRTLINITWRGREHSALSG